MSKTNKLALRLVIVIVALAGGLAIVVPRLVDLDRYRSKVVAQIEEETGKPARIGHLGLSIFPQIAIRVDGFALFNPPGFPVGEFVKARRIYAVVDASALLHRHVVVKSLELEGPNIQLLSDGHGKWNFERAPLRRAEVAGPPSDGKARFTLGVISKFSVRHGDLTSASLLPSGVPGSPVMEVHGALIELRDVALNALTTASPERSDSAKRSEALYGAWMNTTAYAAESPLARLAHGTIKADSLKFGALFVTKLRSGLRLDSKQVFIDDLDMKCYGGRVTGDLSLDFSGPNLMYTTDARIRDVNVAQSLDAFPQARAVLTGILEGTVKVAGEVINSPDPLAGMNGAGLITIRNGKMPSLQLNKDLRTLAQMANLGPANGDPSSFSLLSADFKIKEGRLTNDKITLVGNGLNVKGSGSMTMAGEGSLNYQGTASLATTGSNPLTSLVASFSGGTVTDGRLVLPFTVSGTIAHPNFTLKSVAAGQAGALPAGAAKPADLVRGVAGFLTKKNQQ